MLDVFSVVVRLSQHYRLTFILDRCRDKCSVDFLGTLLIIFVTKVERSRKYSLPSTLYCVMTTFKMSRQSFSFFLGILLNICRGRVSIVTTLFLLIAFSFVATKLKLS